MLAVAGLVACITTSLSSAEEPTGEDYIRFWEPLIGQWKAERKVDGESRVRTFSFQLAPNKACYLVRNEGAGMPSIQRIHGHDPVKKKDMAVGFGDDGELRISTITILNMKKGRKLGVGLIGKWEEKRFLKDGTTSTETSTFSCKLAEKDRMILVWSDRVEDGKAIAEEFVSTMERVE
jgi:hypothetical protein